MAFLEAYFRRVAPSAEEIDALQKEAPLTLDAIGETIRTFVLPRAKGISQDPHSKRNNYLIATDRGNVRINAPTDPLDGVTYLYYPTKVGKGNEERDARIALTLGVGYKYASLLDRDASRPIPYEASPEELAWLSEVLVDGELQPAETHVRLTHEIAEVDAPPAGF